MFARHYKINVSNSTTQDIMLKKVKESIPSLYPFFYQCYAKEIYLYFKNDIILSGPGLFSFVINDSIKSSNTKLNVWFLDDGTLGDRAESVLNALGEVRKDLNGMDLSLHTKKFENFSTKWFLTHFYNARNYYGTNFLINTSKYRPNWYLVILDCS